MHALSTIPLTGNAHFSPIALTNIYSRNPPFRIATGMKHSHTMKDFSILLIVIHLFIFQNTCLGNQRRTISDDFGRHPRFRTAACCICPMSYALYHYRIKIRQIPEAATSINTSQYKTRNSSHLPHTLHRCTNLCRFRFTFDGHPRGDRPYRTYGREHNRSPMQRCTLEAEKRFTFATGQCRKCHYRRCGNGQDRTPPQRCTLKAGKRFTFATRQCRERRYRRCGNGQGRTPLQRCTYFAVFGSPLMAIRGETGHTGPTEGNTTAPLCTGVPICAVFGSPLMAIRGETGHTGPMEGDPSPTSCTGVPICAIFGSPLQKGNTETVATDAVAMLRAARHCEGVPKKRENGSPLMAIHLRRLTCEDRPAKTGSQTCQDTGHT